MNSEAPPDPNLLVAVAGLVVVAALLVKTGCRRLRIPPLIGFLMIGFLLRWMDAAWGLLPRNAESVFSFFGKLGVIALLFSVGVKSDLHKMLRNLRGATVVWLGNVLFSGFLGYVAARVLGFDWIPSLMAGAALTATSVGIPAAVWERKRAVETDEGQFFLDVAELDDLSGITLLAILFGLAPVLRDSLDGDAGGASLLPEALSTVGWVLLKLMAFAGACFLFARYLEKPILRFFERSESGTDAVISLTSLGILIAGLAGLAGFSVAIGAFFAGLAFSRNREAIQNQTPFCTLYDLFVPFFFIGIGLSVEPEVLGGAWVPGGLLLAAAVAGKLLGTLLPSVASLGWRSALTLGVSLVPRAEIAMIIMEHGRQWGDWAVPAELFSAMVLVVLGTCLLAPLAMGRLIDGVVDT